MTPTHELHYLQSLIRQVLNDLPSKRDWLDPQLEAQLRTAVNATTPSSNHRALLDRWQQIVHTHTKGPR